MEELTSKTSFKGYEEGNFVIEVWDEDPVIAREMCSYYVDVLNEMNREIATKEARNFRMFVEQKYNAAMESLENTAREMSVFQKRHGVIDLPEQVVENLKLIGTLTASQLEAEIKYEIASASLGEDSDQVRQSLMELNAIRRKAKQVYNDTSKTSILMNFPELPDLAKEFMLLRSRLIMNEEILKFALPMYEQAKMEEAKNLPVVTILDEPEVPTRKDRPRRLFVLLMSTLSALMLLFIGTTMLFVYQRNIPYFRYIFGLEENDTKA
jgi:capsule polysaccharide export protein KpsE/RkpR